MNKTKAIAKLREKQRELRQAEMVMEMHENAIREIKEDIAKIEEFINKKNNWRFVEVPDKWQELYEKKSLLMEDMMHFAYVKNEGWVPIWGDDEQDKYGLSISNNRDVYSISYCVHNCFLFGIAVKSGEIAREMLTEFGGRIKEIYNKQY
jgi:predicted nuclease with TOPRIM domain